MDETKIVKPLLKWVGGKTQSIEKILSIFPEEINNYHEPFLGGGSVLLALLSYIETKRIKLKGVIYASDLNSNLIEFYRHVKENPGKLIEELDKIISEYEIIQGDEVNRKPLDLEEASTSKESYYYWIRKKFNEESSESNPKISAMFVFLNKTCFRGVFRVGPRGFNVPFGHYKKVKVYEEEHIRNVSKLIQKVVFTTCCYNSSFLKVMSGDFLYLDPPYFKENEKSFVSYTLKKFDSESSINLFLKCKKLGLKGVKFLMSNSNTKEPLKTFECSSYVIETMSSKRAINSKNPESKTEELLIHNLL